MKRHDRSLGQLSALTALAMLLCAAAGCVTAEAQRETPAPRASAVPDRAPAEKPTPVSDTGAPTGDAAGQGEPQPLLPPDQPLSQSAPERTYELTLAKGRVTRVVDGDTVHVKLEDGRVEKVRLIGVDTPESTIEHEPYGKEASAYTKDHLYDKTVYLETDVEQRDRYDRLLAYVWMARPRSVDENGSVATDQVTRYMFNAWLVGDGYAAVMTIPPNVKYAEHFLALQRSAREADKGLWNPAVLEGSDAAEQDDSSRADSSSSGSTDAADMVVGNCNSLKFHSPDCAWGKKISTSHRVAFENRGAAIDAGYVPCKVCEP